MSSTIVVIFCVRSSFLGEVVFFGVKVILFFLSGLINILGEVVFILWVWSYSFLCEVNLFLTEFVFFLGG